MHKQEIVEDIINKLSPISSNLDEESRKELNTIGASLSLKIDDLTTEILRLKADIEIRDKAIEKSREIRNQLILLKIEDVLREYEMDLDDIELTFY